MRSDFSADALVPGTLRVYRQWALAFGYQTGLSSLMFNVIWRQSESATCRTYDCEQCPNVDCSCGIYGYYTPGDRFCDPVSDDDLSLLYGSVTVSGSVVMGTRGVRAQSAVLEAVVVPKAHIFSGRRTILNRLRSTYPDVEFYTTANALLRDYPPDDVSDLIKE